MPFALVSRTWRNDNAQASPHHGLFAMEDSPDLARVTELLDQLCGGNRAAADELFPVIYDELRARARSAKRPSTFRPLSQ